MPVWPGRAATMQPVTSLATLGLVCVGRHAQWCMLCVRLRRWGGWEEDTRTCPSNYPSFAPLGICGHISFVELDAQMVYKQALAYHATKDLQYAQNAFAIVNAWSNTNKAFGMPSQNGPLEAGWGVASLARSLEMLRSAAAFGTVRAAFVGWFNTYLKPQMVAYIDVSTAGAVAAGNLNVYSNW